ncbi:MAG: hypothetical protein KTR32_04395 [Granulosicoccus sp.]|nr:hypothetical protein [Granulosicoccus sp.]
MNRQFEYALYRVLRPLAEILQSQGIAVGEVTPVLKRAFVDAASDALVADGQKPTTARIAIQIGLTRKNVAAIRSSELATNEASNISRINRVVNAWRTESDYQNAENQPLDLPDDGPEPNLRSLIARYSGDMPFNSMKEELTRAGIIKLNNLGSWVLAVTDQQSVPQSEKLPCQFVNEVGALLETINHNLQADSDERLQTVAAGYGLSKTDASEFQNLAIQQTHAMRERLQSWLSDRGYDGKTTDAESDEKTAGAMDNQIAQSDDDNQAQPVIKGAQLGLGIYFFNRTE